MLKRSHVALFASLALVLLAVVLFMSLRQVRRAQDSEAQVVQTLELRRTLYALLSVVQDIESGARSYALTGIPAFLDPYTAGREQVASAESAVRPFLRAGTGQHQQLAALESLITRRLAISAELVQVRRKAGTAKAQTAVATGRGAAVMDSVRAAVEAMDTEAVQRLKDRNARSRRERSNLYWFVGVGSGLAIALLLVGLAMLLRENEKRRLAQAELDRFFTLSLDMLCIAGADATFKRVNPAFTETLGWSAEDLLARPFLDYVHPDDRAATLREVERQVAAGEKVMNFENRYQHKDGSWRVLSWKSAPQPGGLMYATARDVTEQRQAEAELRQLTDALREANAELASAAKLKDEFLANVSHELRTPLNAILGLSETLLEQDEATLTPRQVRSIATISASGAHLLDLINDVLDLSKVEAGKLVVHARPMPLDDFAQGCLAFIRTQAAEKRLSVSFEPGGPAAWVSADPKRLKQVLVNLLSNAVKFTPDGGRIGLTVAASEAEEVVRITVWDTGIGISEEDQRRLFRPFTQIDSGLNRTQEGTGLGLALVHRLVALHDGRVQLESEPGRGSRLVVTLPLIAAAEPDVVAPVWQDKRDLRQALIVEDDSTAADILVRYLAELQISGAVHRRAEGAVEAALRTQPDVILLDIYLPDDSGWVVLTRLKEHLETRDIPVVVISIVDEPEKAVALGATAHLVKPVTRAQLAGVLQREVGHNGHPTPTRGTAVANHRPLVLLAEDNESNRETIGGYLEDKGFDVRYAVDGVEAVAMACRLSPALILMDIQMPVKDGLAAIREIRAVPSLAAVPIVALTALVMPGDRERSLEAGATEYLSKPVSLKGLTALVQGLLSGVR